MIDNALGLHVLLIMITVSILAFIGTFALLKFVFKKGVFLCLTIALLFAIVSFFATPYVYLKILHLRGIEML